MRPDLVERRLRLLDYFLSGGTTRENMRALAKEYKVKEQTLWNDLTRRAKWIPQLFSMTDADAKVRDMASVLEKTLIRAYRLSITAKNEGTQIGAQRNVALLVDKLHDLYESHGVTPSIYTKLIQTLSNIEKELGIDEDTG